MTSEHGVAEVPGGGARLRRALRVPANWVQLLKFCAVGTSGYVVNLGIFTLAVEVAALHHLLGAALAFLVAVTNNFHWNRSWTFGARAQTRRFQAPRFLAVSVGAALLAAGGLQLLVSAGLAAVAAQAVSIAAATPLNFLGNKLWSFGRRAGR